MLTGFFTTAISFIRPWPLGQRSTSRANVRHMSSAHGRYARKRPCLPGSALAAGISGVRCPRQGCAEAGTPA